MFEDGSVRSISKMQTSSNSDLEKEKLKDIFIGFLRFKDEYKKKPVKYIIYQYKISDKFKSSDFSYPLSDTLYKTFEFKGHLLPNTMDL